MLERSAARITQVTISEPYREMMRQLHASSPTWGTGAFGPEPEAIGLPWYTDLIAEIASMIGARSVLDYGAGKCVLNLSNLRRYDPAVPGIDDLPEPADLVVSRCVLEHIEPQCIEAVLHHMASLSKMAVLHVVSLREANTILPDGRNAHLLIKPMEWWLSLLMRHWEPNTAMRLPKQRFWFFGRTRD